MPGRIKKEIDTIGNGVIDKVATLIISAFGFVAALAWNTAIQKIIPLFLTPSNEVMGALAYAVIVTGIAVVVTIYLTRLSERLKKKEA